MMDSLPIMVTQLTVSKNEWTIVITSK